MSKRIKSSRKANIPAMVVLGFGLILAGMTAYIAWPKPDRDDITALEFNSEIVPVEVNYEAPLLSLADLTGTEHSLTEYRGQVVLVNLWATWCPPCKAEMPILIDFYETYYENGFVVIAINDGDPEKDVENFVKEYKLTFPVWLDPTYEATERAFKILTLPSTFVIDRAGDVRLRWVGEIDRAALEKYVTPLILE